MNATRLRELAAIVRVSATFEQNAYFHECGAPACIAGHEYVRMRPGRQWFRYQTEIVAARSLDLTPGEADTLFDLDPDLEWPEPFCDHWFQTLDIEEDDTRHRAQAVIAADYLEHLADQAEGRAS